MTEEKKKRIKYDKWFVLVLLVLLWTLATQLIDIATVMPYNLTNISLWARLIASSVGLFGAVWVLRSTLTGAKKQQTRITKLDIALKDQPELRKQIIDILEETT